MRPIIGFPWTWLRCVTLKGGCSVPLPMRELRTEAGYASGNGWDAGALKNWQPIGNVWHPEVGPNGRNVGGDLYLGYGPLDYDNKKHVTILNNKRNKRVLTEDR
jgi:hypothetical protein